MAAAQPLMAVSWTVTGEARYTLSTAGASCASSPSSAAQEAES